MTEQHEKVINLLQLITLTTPITKPHDQTLRNKTVEVGNAYHEKIRNELGLTLQLEITA